VSFRGAKCKEGLVYIFAEGMKECERVFQKPVSSSLLFLDRRRLGVNGDPPNSSNNLN
jgi:hypothetical protein